MVFVCTVESVDRDGVVVNNLSTRSLVPTEPVTMCIYEDSDKSISVQTDACYEEQARQEEIYLEKTEEDLRMILEF